MYNYKISLNVKLQISKRYRKTLIYNYQISMNVKLQIYTYKFTITNVVIKCTIPHVQLEMQNYI